MIMGESNLMMGLTLVLVISLATVLALVLVLLAELYCSILLRRRNTTTTTTTTTVNNHHPQPPSLTNLGVLSAPRNLLYPTLAGNVAGAGEPAGEFAGDIEKQQNLEVISDGYDRKSISGRKDELGQFYISNPVFDDGDNGRRKMGTTPFETPETSPSRLGTEGDEDDDDEEEIMLVTPPLTPMKKLPAAVVDGGGVSSTSSSGTPCTSSFSWTTTTTVNNHHPQPPSLTNLGVLSAPRNLLYPTLAGNVAGAGEPAGEFAGDIEKQQNLEVISDGYDRKSISGRKDELGQFYISNPVFDDGDNGRRKMGTTPFETPETSPSRLGTEGDEDDDDEEEIMLVTPPLTPMKKLPAAVVDGGGVSSTSSSGTPCTSSFSW